MSYLYPLLEEDSSSRLPCPKCGGPVIAAYGRVRFRDKGVYYFCAEDGCSYIETDGDERE